MPNLKQYEDLTKLSSLLLQNNSNKQFRLPPALKTSANLEKFLKFAFAYYDSSSELTLKNAPKYLTFTKVSISKVHLWLQQVCYGIRISLLMESDNASKTMDYFKSLLGKSPLVMKSALDKYKYIHLAHFSDTDFSICCQKELDAIRSDNILPGFLGKDFKIENEKNSMINSIKVLVDASEELDAEGKFSLSEKILESTEVIAERYKNE